MKDAAHRHHPCFQHTVEDAIDNKVLADGLRFAPDSGVIHCFDQRMLLMHAFSVASLRRELIERLGLDKAREMFTRLGYQQGVEDARSLVEHQGGDVHEILALLPRLREMQGFVHNRAVDRMQLNTETGEFYADYHWQSSWEADAHLKHVGISGTPACWMMVGYATGATTALMGRPIVWREVECMAMGHSRCRVIAQPLEDCDDADGHLDFLQIEEFVSAPRKYQRPVARPIQLDEAAEEFPDLVGASASFNAAVHLLKRVAPTDATVLLKGESGVGKERFCKTLHSIGPRSQREMISVNCAAIPAELVEAELFGVEKGAFTGATASRPGRFERAHGGTLFLDEVASLPLHAQGKLLRVLQEGEVERVGGTSVIPVDVRIVAAANRDLREEVKAGRFREDLFFRLNVFPIEIPPLRERRDDIPLLVNVFVRRYANRFNRHVKGLTRRANEALWAYHWPGNVRELENIIERAVILMDDDSNLDSQHLFSGGEQLRDSLFRVGTDGELHRTVPGSDDKPAELNSDSVALPGRKTAGSEQSDEIPSQDRESMLQHLLSSVGSLEDMETMALDYALAQCNGNVSAAARMLNMRRAQFEYRLKKRQGK